MRVCHHSGRSIFHSFFHSSIHGGLKANNTEYCPCRLFCLVAGLAICSDLSSWGYSYRSSRVFRLSVLFGGRMRRLFRHIPLPRRVSRRHNFLIGHPTRSGGGAGSWPSDGGGWFLTRGGLFRLPLVVACRGTSPCTCPSQRCSSAWICIMGVTRGL